MRPLLERLRLCVRERGPISFAEYMEAALYDPAAGYYGRGRAPGREGDFFTAGDLGSGLALLLATQIQETLQRVPEIPRPRIVELGPGSGRLLVTLLEVLGREAPELLSGVEVAAVERSAALAGLQRENLGARAADTVRWAGLDELARAPAPAVVLGNELIDALPVRRLVLRQGRLLELRVALGDDRLLELVERDAAPELRAELDGWGFRPPEGCVFEIRPAAGPLLCDLAAAVPVGLLLLIDYGDEASTLFGPARPNGTVRAYSGHELVSPLEAPGERDITASVDFTALARQAEAAGFEVLGTRPLVEAALALGAAERIAALAGAADREALRTRMSLLSLTAPGGIGSSFQVFVAVRGEGVEPVRALGPLRRSE